MQGFCFSNKFKVAGMVKQRIQLFDIARGLAIFMVISAHTLTIFKGTSISNFLFLGNLAVFFVVSGYFYRPKSLMQIVKTGVNTLLIPYFIAVIGYLLIRGFIGVVFFAPRVHYDGKMAITNLCEWCISNDANWL